MRCCKGRVNDTDSPCMDWCIYEQEKIWCTCYDASNIHQWHWLNQKTKSMSFKRGSSCSRPHSNAISEGGSLNILDSWCLREVRNRTIANGGVAFVALREVIKHLRTSVIGERDEVLNLVAHEINELWNFNKISEEVYVNFIDKIRELRTPAPEAGQ